LDWSDPTVRARAANEALSLSSREKNALQVGDGPAVKRVFDEFMLDAADPSHWRDAFDSMARALFPPKEPRKHKWTDEEKALFIEYVEQIQRFIKTKLLEGAPLGEGLLDDIPVEMHAKIRREWERGFITTATLRRLAVSLLRTRRYRHDSWNTLDEYALKGFPKKRKFSPR
jgi:hypothetical protein